jgi:photosystem II stability/assembly factor-like uncharacterized protein
VYALDYGSAIYKTVNGGASWVKRTPQLSEAPYAIALDPAHPATIYAGSEVIEGRKWLIARSGNGGRTWQPLSAGLRRSASEVRAIGVARKTGATYAAVNQETQGGYAGDAVYRLARGGKRWTPIARGLPRGSDDRPAEIRSLAVDPRTGSVRVGTNLGLYGLVRSQGALRWQLVDPSLAGLTMRRLAYAADGSRLYAATPNRFLVSP